MRRFEPEEIKTKIEIGLLKTILPRIKPYKVSLIFCLILVGCSSLLSLAGPLLIRHAIDVNFPKKDINGLFITAALYMIVLILTFVLAYFQTIKLETIGQAIIKKIRIDIFTHLTKMSQSFFDKNPVGQLLSRVESDTESIRAMFTFTVVMLLSDLLMVGGMLVIMFSISFRLTLVLLFITPLVIFNILYFNKKIIPPFIEGRKKTAHIYGFLEEYIRGSIIVQAFSREEDVIKKMDKINRIKVDVEYPGHMYSSYFGHIIFFLSTLGNVLILGIGGKWVIENPKILTIGTLVAFLSYIYRFFGPIFHISEQINIIQKAFAGMKRINEILNHEVQSYIETKEPPVSDKRGIEFKNVWFAYKEEEWVLKDISFFIPEGSSVAIVGPTGGGKSTIANLLFRFYEYQKGQILLNGIDITTIPLKELRKNLGLVLQDIILFQGTILDNLTFGNNEISEVNIFKAIESLDVKDFTEKLPKGLNTELSEYGNNMSVGEKQLLSFIRAMVYNPSILVLDEATSSIDPLTEQKLQKAVLTLLKGRTSIIIAHRLQTILECNNIMVIENGEIKEKGSHKELLAVKGLYSNLYNIQSGEKVKDNG